MAKNKRLIKPVAVFVFILILLITIVIIIDKRENITADDIIADQDTEMETPSQPEITWMTFPEAREITAQQYFVYSKENGEFLMSGGDSEKVYPASITKLFTAYTALQYLEPADVIVVGDALDMVAPGSSVAGLQKGNEITVEKLIEAMMLPSGNDAAYVLACEVGWILEENVHYSLAAERFVQEMNTTAKTLGMSNTNFANPDGIHEEDHYTTYNDLIIMAGLALDDPTIAKYAKTAGDIKRLWFNTNALVDPESDYYCPLSVGLKTGQTPSAGSCLLSAFEYNDEVIIIGVFGCPDVDSRFADTLQLFNMIFVG